jgi:DNA-3-methyladenine glycosylase
MPAVIKAKVFQSKNTVALARWLLGKVLAVSGINDETRRVRICETEAYHGESDIACHASKGRTGRTEVMYAAGGVWYVYLCYGVHEMLNLVTGPVDQPSAVLIRGVEGIVGPGRLTRALGIDRRLNTLPADPATGLWLEDDGFVVPRSAIVATPRIGVAYAGPVWAAKPWRFFYEPGETTGTVVRRRKIEKGGVLPQRGATLAGHSG